MTTLHELAGFIGRGRAELWLDPLGNEAEHSNCTLTVDPVGFTYTWSHDGKPYTGRVSGSDAGVMFQDSWHQGTPVVCTPVAGSGAIVDVAYAYAGGEGPAWTWRISLARRPDGTMVLQMTNIAPWGEHARAVRMQFTPA